jgi:hypothetical protein
MHKSISHNSNKMSSQKGLTRCLSNGEATGNRTPVLAIGGNGKRVQRRTVQNLTTTGQAGGFSEDVVREYIQRGLHQGAIKQTGRDEYHVDFLLMWLDDTQNGLAKMQDAPDHWEQVEQFRLQFP